MTGKVLGLLSEVSHGPTKPTKMIAEQENDFGKTLKIIWIVYSNSGYICYYGLDSLLL